MPFSFQEGFRSVLQKAKKNPRLLHDANSSELSSKSTPESSASWPSAKPPKECLPVYGLVNVLGGCFLQSKTKHEDVGTVCQQVFENPSSNKPLQSVGNFLLDVTREKSPVAIFTISELIKATDNFSPSLNIGQGGFGTVYKGKLNGSFVAIKRAKKVIQILVDVHKPKAGVTYIRPDSSKNWLSSAIGVTQGGCTHQIQKDDTIIIQW
eukprot:c23418_g1_i2 orf=410-1036(+)